MHQDFRNHSRKDRQLTELSKRLRARVINVLFRSTQTTFGRLIKKISGKGGYKMDPKVGLDPGYLLLFWDLYIKSLLMA